MDISRLRSLLALDAALERNKPALQYLQGCLSGCASPEAFANVVHATARKFGLLPDWRKADQYIAWLDDNDATIITYGDGAYPPHLREIPAPPLMLATQGDLGLLDQPSIAIVGSRRATTTGRRFAQRLAEQISASGIAVVSGLAIGIDTAAHRGAIASIGSTVAVLGCGLNVPYPRQNRELRHQIATSGLVISEFSLGAQPLKHHFPRRNRIISGLALGVVVVEAARRSGSISTASHALEQGREVFAVPGNVGNPMSAGCHALIKQGAKLTEGLADIVEELPQLAEAAAKSDEVIDKQRASVEAISRADPAFRLLDAVGWSKFTVDELVVRTGLTVPELSSMLLALELEGRVEAHANGMYSRVN